MHTGQGFVKIMLPLGKGRDILMRGTANWHFRTNQTEEDTPERLWMVGRQEMRMEFAQKDLQIIECNNRSEYVRLALAVLEGDMVSAKILADKVLIGD